MDYFVILMDKNITKLPKILIKLKQNIKIEVEFE